MLAFEAKDSATLVVHTGFDGIQEELYTQCVLAALQRGHNCLTFEGPGQGRVIRLRRDWEKVRQEEGAEDHCHVGALSSQPKNI